jgi:tripartite-type tricarboxylate transporter receptor subunit TctC
MRRTATTMILCGAAVLATAPAAPAADSYPTKNITLIVGFGAGGPTDIPARFIAEKLGDMLGHRIVVENKPGAAGQIATRDALAQKRDGYTLLLCTHFESINTVLYRHVGFKLSDLAPISLIEKYYYGLTLSNSVPADTFGDFVKYSKAHPGVINYVSIGAGSAQEIFARQLGKITGISMNRIPFRTGTQAIPEIIAGRVQFYVAPTLSVLPLYQKKELKVLAVTAPERLKNAPKIPTLKDDGIDFIRFGWLGICAGAGTPQPVIDLLNRDIRKIVATPEYKALIEKGGAIPASSSPAELRTVLKQTVDDVASTIREFGLQQN